MITKKSIMIKYLFLFIPIIAFSQSRDYKNKVKSSSYSFLTEIEINKTRYLEDYIVKATKLGYELLRNKSRLMSYAKTVPLVFFNKRLGFN